MIIKKKYVFTFIRSAKVYLFEEWVSFDAYWKFPGSSTKIYVKRTTKNAAYSIKLVFFPIRDYLG